ncbi:hypothetical protein QAD02_003542 [Eretmocerus hayati]|uniref:Uncharacterized protein n=1 Tax=Eretmocerus hayati TaxID=131215 RepID=A0ACC2NN39_9HYME|nr:hypothetical protein QAD02_003542 [Eretmocerus hayati]
MGENFPSEVAACLREVAAREIDGNYLNDLKSKSYLHTDWRALAQKFYSLKSKDIINTKLLKRLKANYERKIGLIIDIFCPQRQLARRSENSQPNPQLPVPRAQIAENHRISDSIVPNGADSSERVDSGALNNIIPSFSNESVYLEDCADIDDDSRTTFDDEIKEENCDTVQNIDESKKVYIEEMLESLGHEELQKGSAASRDHGSQESLCSPSVSIDKADSSINDMDVDEAPESMDVLVNENEADCTAN